MMKKMISMLLAALLCVMLLPVQAAEAGLEALYRIVCRTEAGERTLGTGVLFGSQQTLLTARTCWAEGELAAIGADGEHAVTYRSEIAGTQLILLGLADACAAEPMQITSAERLRSNSIYGATGAGFTEQTAVLSRATAIDGRAEVLLSAGKGLLPGAVMLGADGGLACVVVWQHGEGEAVYAALANVTLNGLVERGAQPEETEGLLHGFTATIENGNVVLDWSEARGYTMTENTVFTAYITATSNPYLSYDRVSGATGTSFPAIPGTQMLVWIAVSEGEPAEHVYPETDADSVLLTIPEGVPFTQYGLRNIRCGVTPGIPGRDGWTEDFLPQMSLTREVLSDRSIPIYFQTEDVYQTDVEDDGHTLLLALYTPEGYVFCYYSSYYFAPELQGSDLWVSDISEVFAEYEQFVPEEERWPAGEYAVVYLIDGCEVARVPFILD